jgi:hypothetical protein
VAGPGCPIGAPRADSPGVLRVGDACERHHTQGLAGDCAWLEAPAPTAITVTLGASTTVTQTVPATRAAAVVGQCASAFGSANSTATINAKSITVSSPGPNGCRSGFGGRFNGNGPGGTGTGSTGGTNA